MIAIKLKLGQAGRQATAAVGTGNFICPIEKHDVRKMARKIAKGNCHKKAATKKAAKQFIVAALGYCFLWLSGKHIHIHAHTCTHLNIYIAPHTHLCTFIVAYICAPPKQFLSFCQRAAFAAFYVAFSLYTHTYRSARCVCVPCCARCPFVWGIRIKNYAVLVAPNAKQVNPEMSPLPPHSVVCYFICNPQCGDYFVYNAFANWVGP